GHDYPALSRGNRLSGMKTETAHDSPGTRFSALRFRPERTGGILDYRNPEASSDLEYLEHVRHPAKGVNRQDRLDSRALQNFCQCCRRHIERAGLDIDEHRFGTD